jgi:PilZ domain
MERSVQMTGALRHDDMPDKRRFQRIRPSGAVAKTATIYADLKSPSIPCTIVDTGAGGACLEVQGTSAIPKKFTLNHGGVKKTCRVVWQKGRRIGVAF